VHKKRRPAVRQEKEKTQRKEKKREKRRTKEHREKTQEQGQKAISLGEALSSLENKDLSEILNELVLRNINIFDANSRNTVLKLEDEVIEVVKNKLIDLLTASHAYLQERISALRKSGHDTKMLEIQSMSIPLKIKIFGATHAKKDFDKVIPMLDTLKKNIDNSEKQKNLTSSQDDKTQENDEAKNQADTNVKENAPPVENKENTTPANDEAKNQADTSAPKENTSPANNESKG
jgi:hypothetical protein